MSYMADMSRAIRLELERHGGNLDDVPDDVLRDYVLIAGAFVADMQDELARRAAKANGQPAEGAT